MGILNAVEFVTLDGVMQSPGRPDEDVRDGFDAGGWAEPIGRDPDAASMSMAGRGSAAAMLFGHRTYDDLVGHWLGTAEENPFTPIFRDTPKYVATRDPDARLAYPNSETMVGEAADTVAALKQRIDGEIVLLGSGRLLHDLVAAHLVDRFVLTIIPVVLGRGLRLWGSTPLDLDVRESYASPTTGIVVQRADVRYPNA